MTIKQRVLDFFIEAHTKYFIENLKDLGYIEDGYNQEDLETALESLLENGDDLNDNFNGSVDLFIKGYSFDLVSEETGKKLNTSIYIFKVTTPTEKFYFQISSAHSSHNGLKEVFFDDVNKSFDDTSKLK